ncbi:MAG: Ppx/GppA family phosphatase, partial [Planctomycetota bacterium]
MVDGQVSGAQSERRIAALDVGTNSLRLIVAEASPDGSYRVIDDEKVIVRLGQGLATTGRLAEDRIEAAAEAIDHLRDIAQGYQVEELRAVATAAVREAPNGPDLVAVVRDRSGVELRVISAAEEARLSYRSVDNAFSIRHRNTVIADIGGGSTEILLSVGGVVDRVYLLKLGAVRLTEMFGPCETEEQFEMMRSYVRDHLKEHVDRPPFGADLMFGTGGTFTAVAGM